MQAVAPPELLVMSARRRLDGEVDGALKDERELVLVVVAEAIGAGLESCQQRFQMPSDEAFGERPGSLTVHRR